MASFYRKQCLTCDESFDAQVDRAYQDICPKCQKYMDATEPKTDDERKMNDYIQGLNDNALGAVGMGGYFSGLDRAQHQQASAQHEVATPPIVAVRCHKLISSSKHRSAHRPLSKHPRPRQKCQRPHACSIRIH